MLVTEVSKKLNSGGHSLPVTAGQKGLSPREGCPTPSPSDELLLTLAGIGG